MKKSTLYILMLIGASLFALSCTNTSVNQPITPSAPKTYLWLFPDSSLTEGPSKQHVHWWGEAPNGIVRGYIFAAGKLPGAAQGKYGDSTKWRWKFGNDTLVAFPLRTERDTFQIAARTVDNAFTNTLPDNALIRFVTGSAPYWDKNEDGRFDSSDVKLPTLLLALDPKGASLNIPLLNSPPSISWGQDPHNPGNTIQQPESTFTAATFSWVGTDPDGDSTITHYELALNDTTDTTRIVTVTASTKFLTLFVPRARSNGLVGVQEVVADLYSGTVERSLQMIGQIQHLKLNSKNVLYVRARDIAGAASSFISLPAKGDNAHVWYVRNPTGNVLLVEDYISSDRDSALAFYKRALPAAGFPKFDVIDIGEGLSATAKSNSNLGSLVPTFVDPAFVLTLDLYDAVIWYTDAYPSLAVAQVPLFEYTHDQTRHGKVIFSTTFQTATDPSGALEDFAPLDSVSTAALPPSRLLPSIGDTRIPGGFVLNADSAAVAFGFTPLKFNTAQANYSVYMRPIYKRIDADYLFQIQADSGTGINALRYVNLPTVNDIHQIAASSPAHLWETALGGDLLSTTDDGASWSQQTLADAPNLNSVSFTDASHGMVTGDGGEIYSTADGGKTWNPHALFTFENLEDVTYLSQSSVYICGTTGILIHATDGGSKWSYLATHSSAQLNSVRFIDVNNGVVVGDSGTILHTTNGGATWTKSAKVTPDQLFCVRYLSSQNLVAVGGTAFAGVIVRSTDGGVTWATQASGVQYPIHSVSFIDNVNGWLTAGNGNIWKTSDGGATWTNQPAGIEEVSGTAQVFNCSYFSSATEGFVAGTGGLTMKTTNSGAKWTPVPSGPIHIACVDGVGTDGKRSIVFVGLPLHYLNGTPSSAALFFQNALHTLLGL